MLVASRAGGARDLLIMVVQSVHLNVAHITQLQELLEVPTPIPDIIEQVWGSSCMRARTHTQTNKQTKKLSQSESDGY